MSTLEHELEKLRLFAKPALFPYAWGGSAGTAMLRVAPEDFGVIECGAVLPTGVGEHLLLRVRKTGQNTRWVAKRLAELANVPYRSVSYAGLKDRHAVTEQWFSVHLPGQPDPELLLDADCGFEVLESCRHDHKLRPGQLSHNLFELRLRDCRLANPEQLEFSLSNIRESGVPNYFGAQRFGRAQGNLYLLNSVAGLRRINREAKSFALSALRSALFNGYLAERVADGSWSTALDGEKLISDRPRGSTEHAAGGLSNRRSTTGLLWGQKPQWSDGIAGEREQAFYNRFPQLLHLLEKAGCRCSRRVLTAQVGELNWSLQDDQAVVTFALGPGSYATMVVRELVDAKDMALQESEA